MNFTQNYSLNQWSKTDRIRMDDFNADNAKLDAALAAKTEVITGTYTGDGSSDRTVSLERTVTLLVVQRTGRRSANFTEIGWLAGEGCVHGGTGGGSALTHTGDGFLINDASAFNESGTVYRYVAITA